jgi:hypothetical protein
VPYVEADVRVREVDVRVRVLLSPPGRIHPFAAKAKSVSSMQFVQTVGATAGIATAGEKHTLLTARRRSGSREKGGEHPAQVQAEMFKRLHLFGADGRTCTCTWQTQAMATQRRWGRRSLAEPHGGLHDVDQLADLVAALWHGDHVT